MPEIYSIAAKDEIDQFVTFRKQNSTEHYKFIIQFHIALVQKLVKGTNAPTRVCRIYQEERKLLHNIHLIFKTKQHINSTSSNLKIDLVLELVPSQVAVVGVEVPPNVALSACLHQIGSNQARDASN